MSDTIRFEIASENRSRRERRDRFRMGNEFAAQFFNPQPSSSLNLRIIDSSGDSVLCHTEIVENDYHIFPDELDEYGQWHEKPGGYVLTSSFARIEDFLEILKFFYFDYLTIDKNTLTLPKLDRLIYAAYLLTQMPLYYRLLTLKRTFHESLALLINNNVGEVGDQENGVENQWILQVADAVTASSYAALLGADVET
jgi:hypothetical protein